MWGTVGIVDRVLYVVPEQVWLYLSFVCVSLFVSLLYVRGWMYGWMGWREVFHLWRKRASCRHNE